jgi:hypothetical protein
MYDFDDQKSDTDDLPVWGFIGEKETMRKNGEERTSYHLFTHYIFSITYNGNQVLAPLVAMICVIAPIFLPSTFLLHVASVRVWLYFILSFVDAASRR